MAWSAIQRSDRQFVEGGDRISLRPETDAARGKPAVASVDERLIVEPPPDVVADSRNAQLMPLAERRRLDACAGDLTAAAVVVVEIEVALERVGADHVVAAFSETEDDAA